VVSARVSHRPGAVRSRISAVAALASRHSSEVVCPVYPGRMFQGEALPHSPRRRKSLAQLCRMELGMERNAVRVGMAFVFLVSWLTLAGCKTQPADAAAEAPPVASVIPDFNVVAFSVDHPEQFPLATAAEHDAPSHLVVTGAVNPDVARNVPVISLASGRVVSINARLGDTVKKGQLLLRVRSDDISGAFANYKMAAADEVLARAQWERAQELYKHGAIALNDLQVAQDAEDKAEVAVDTAAEHLRLLGSTVEHPSGIVDIVAPVSGVITDQQVTNAGGVQALGTSPFTISDLSRVWIVCDVYENDLPTVSVGDSAEITLNAYPGKVLKGTISNIAPILDPNIRTAKVRIEVANPGLMRVGMFVTATFRGRKNEVHTTVPATAILHLHDREYVYVPSPEKKFRRVEVISGSELPGGMQEIMSGIPVGQQVVSNAVVLQHTVEQ
jgi:cobalt-zinc-cadmium efflux system membrane fusion protein